MFGAEFVAGIAIAALPCMLALFYVFFRFEPTDEPVVEADGVSR
ncbi:hypothetical protein [Halorientalis regularis]|jgi:hypothetical protein|uniref:Uncharacterized protein n=1 Tax=Halorientalis regularis TaxID=660518 RepID=A0A1G7PHJ4_9EURY|nr:hypothetical protein [Halorientalis regularis]SDF85733.1 hypothetical protein SAMN05216218_110131 [Halorientalis regularis]